MIETGIQAAIRNLRTGPPLARPYCTPPCASGLSFEWFTRRIPTRRESRSVRPQAFGAVPVLTGIAKKGLLQLVLLSLLSRLG